MKKIKPGYPASSLYVGLCLLAIKLISCSGNATVPDSIQLVNEPAVQQKIFSQLLEIGGEAIPQAEKNDSLAFLVLPMQASCPSCRKKTIDSIVANQTDLPQGHFVILSQKGGRKTLNAFFLERDAQIPSLDGRLIFDSLNLARGYNLYETNTAIYYAYNGKVYKKVLAVPATVKDDLCEFFSGHRPTKKGE